MRVRGDLAPSNAFSLEEQPKKPGFVLVRFYGNVEPSRKSTTTSPSRALNTTSTIWSSKTTTACPTIF